MTPPLDVPSRSRPSGAAVAAFLAPVVGLLAMDAANIADQVSPASEPRLLAIGSWMPGYRGIGPYSGMETVLLVAWLSSWAALHFALRRRDLAVRPWAIVMVLGLSLAAALVWPPILDFILGK